jgi:hypothetical protein
MIDFLSCVLKQNMKLLFIPLFVSFASYAQTEKAVRFKVEFQDFQYAIKGGGWTDWKELGNMNKEIEETITINYTNKTVATDFKFEDTKREFHTYKIGSLVYDDKYEDFGFYASTMKVEEEGKIKTYILVYSSCENKYVLIVSDAAIKTRYKLKEI